MKIGGKRILIFLGGLVAGAAAKKVLESQSVRQLAVDGVAKGIKLQKSAQETLENLKEDAQDIHHDAAKKVDEEDAIEAKVEEIKEEK
ncbi:MAG: DUF6110 family protein [Andreesenia angusta]|nr:DUF6110 family protein [Andreesenia angusta]